MLDLVGDWWLFHEPLGQVVCAQRRRGWDRAAAGYRRLSLLSGTDDLNAIMRELVEVRYVVRVGDADVIGESFPAVKRAIRLAPFGTNEEKEVAGEAPDAGRRGNLPRPP